MAWIMKLVVWSSRSGSANAHHHHRPRPAGLGLVLWKDNETTAPCETGGNFHLRLPVKLPSEDIDHRIRDIMQNQVHWQYNVAMWRQYTSQPSHSASFIPLYPHTSLLWKSLFSQPIYSSSSSSSSPSSPPDAFFAAAFMFLRFTLPGRPPP